MPQPFTVRVPAAFRRELEARLGDLLREIELYQRDPRAKGCRIAEFMVDENVPGSVLVCVIDEATVPVVKTSSSAAANAAA